MKRTLVFFLALLLFFILPTFASAKDQTVSGSAVVATNATENEFDRRVHMLENFLVSKNSPLSTYSEEFVYFADKYNIDYRLVPAISGVESSFGKRIPSGSYNAYGWANGDRRFKSWEESIEVVNRALREKYYNKGAGTIDKIARRYCPPSTTWSYKVKYFMDQIDSVPADFDL